MAATIMIGVETLARSRSICVCVETGLVPFGGGGRATIETTCDLLVVRPPESIARTTTVSFPVEEKECVAVLVVDHAVSRVPSPVQSQRTWIELGKSWSSLACAVNVNTVLVSPTVGAQTKSTVGGAFGGGSGPTRS